MACSKMLRNISALAECIVCLSVPREKPIYQCVNGHLICSKCREDLNPAKRLRLSKEEANRCPVCMSKEGFARCIIAEDLILTYGYHECFNEGCQFSSTLDNVKQHEEKICRFREFYCPGMECRRRKVKVPFNKLEEHIIQEGCCSVNNKATNDLIYPKDIGDSVISVICLKFDNHLFFLETVLVQDVLHAWLAMAGNEFEGNPTDYVGRIKVTSNNGEQTIETCGPVQRLSNDVFSPKHATLTMTQGQLDNFKNEAGLVSFNVSVLKRRGKRGLE